MIGTKEVYDIFDFIYPVGIIIELTVETNPKELFGIGTWEPYMPGRVLVGAGAADSGTVYEAGTIGGEETHTLTVDGMPSHTHTPVISSGANVIQEFKLNNDWDGDGSYTYPAFDISGNMQSYTVRLSTEGGNQPHNNMQPYGVIYRWKRVS